MSAPQAELFNAGDGPGAIPGPVRPGDQVDLGDGAAWKVQGVVAHRGTVTAELATRDARQLVTVLMGQAPAGDSLEGVMAMLDSAQRMIKRLAVTSCA